MPHLFFSTRAALFALIISGSGGLQAEISLAPLFADHAVLQREKKVPVWGWGRPGEAVIVTFAGQSKSATVDREGHWQATLEPLAASAVGTELVVRGTNTITVHDVLVGEVWLCSGQSNMELAVSNSRDAAQEIAASDNPLIRHLKVRSTVAPAPAETVQTSGWELASPRTTGKFTAAGYYFAREIQKKLGVPVGLVNSSVGSTPVESWMSPTALGRDPSFQVVGERWSRVLAEYPEKKTAYAAEFALWKRAADSARTAGQAEFAAWQERNPAPIEPPGPGHRWTPSGLYNGMIHPLVPGALRGVLWYQGERNAADEHVGEYRVLLTAMIEGWRADFQQGELPFFWVNLANLIQTEKTGRRWAFFREVQTQTLVVPGTGQAIAIDIGDLHNIHAPNKQDVGLRLALLAENRVYGLPTEDTGPTFSDARRDGASLRVRLTHADGLTSQGEPVGALELAGADRNFHAAEGRIEGQTLVVTSVEVKAPVAVRYAWVNAPAANLHNRAGLPAVPFRSDDW